MRSGFTTGSCAAAAAKAASYMLFTGQLVEKIGITTPAGVAFEPKVEEVKLSIEEASCLIRKDAGDDPDITDGIYIGARVSRSNSSSPVTIVGGIGVGRVTRPGLEMPVGDWAINSTPRRMIEREVEEVMELLDETCSLQVEIFVPEGEEIARKTFNPHMGIEGGISILGTTGIVEPMSTEALKKTIELDLSQKKAEGNEVAVLVPGNYAVTFLKSNYDYEEKRVIPFSNYVGFAIDQAVEAGFKKILLVGHTGKLVKVAGGIMNTHSHEADARMELMSAALIRAAKKNGFSIDIELLDEILDSVTTTACLDILSQRGILSEVSEELLDEILYHLRKRAGEGIEVECILYENSYGLLAKSKRADEFLI